VILRASDVTDLQYFLMDAARRYVVAAGAPIETADDLLASAAALDYALLLSSEHGDEPFGGAEPVAATLRDTMTRAAVAALDFAENMRTAPQEVVDDFVDRHARAGGLFDVLQALRREDVLASGDVAFRAVTLASDLRERRTPAEGR
jgi:hypothetical protein